MCRLASNQYIAEADSEPRQHCTLCRQLVSDLVFRQRTKQENLQVELVSPLAGPIHTQRWTPTLAIKRDTGPLAGPLDSEMPSQRRTGT